MMTIAVFNRLIRPIETVPMASPVRPWRVTYSGLSGVDGSCGAFPGNKGRSPRVPCASQSSSRAL